MYVGSFRHSIDIPDAEDCLLDSLVTRVGFETRIQDVLHNGNSTERVIGDERKEFYIKYGKTSKTNLNISLSTNFYSFEGKI